MMDRPIPGADEAVSRSCGHRFGRAADHDLGCDVDVVSRPLVAVDHGPGRHRAGNCRADTHEYVVVEMVKPTGRRGRLKKLAIVVIVIAAVLVAADFGLASAAEYQVSKGMRTELNLADDPSVTIHGFPFTTQALSGSFKDVTVMASHMPVQDKLRDAQINVELRNVQVGASELLSGHVSTVKIGQVDGSVQIQAADVGRLLGINDLQVVPQTLNTALGVVTAGAVPNQYTDGQRAGAELTGTVDIAGQQTKVSVFGLIELVNGSIVVSPKRLEVSNNMISGPLASTVENQVMSRFNLTLNPSELPLPFTVRATGVVVYPGSLTVQGTATNVVLNNNGSGF